jgi:hypothetical protein
MWPKSFPPSPNPDEKYEDWIQIPPPPENDPSTDALPKREQDDPTLWVPASWLIPAFWLLLLFLAWFFAGPGREDRTWHAFTLNGGAATAAAMGE